MAEQRSVISCHDVWFTYDGPWVLESVNVSVAEHDLVCVIGPNGGGKSTFLKLLLGLLEPDRGRVAVLGTTPMHARRRIGYMPQHAQLDPQFPVSVLDVVLMGRLADAPVVGPYRRRDREVARAALADVGLADVAARPYAALSGGQRQRVLIARALACEPELLLLDEPTANLDPSVQESLFELLGSLKQRVTILVVSHDVGFVSLFFRTVICIDHGAHTHVATELTAQQVTEMYGREVRLLHHRCYVDHDRVRAKHDHDHGDGCDHANATPRENA